jgi:hypothetical protein
MAFIFGFIELSLAFYSYDLISELAREGTRYAIVHGSTCVTASGTSCTASAASIGTYVSGIGLPNLGAGTMSVAVSFPDGNEAPSSRVKVTVNYVFPYKVPFMMSGPISMSSNSEMYIIQ